MDANKKSVKRIMEAFDADGSNEIGFEEFAELVETHSALMYERPEADIDLPLAREVFKDLDEDDSGCIKTSELGEALGLAGIHIHSVALRTLILRFDIDNSGTLDVHEFAKLMASYKEL